MEIAQARVLHVVIFAILQQLLMTVMVRDPVWVVHQLRLVMQVLVIMELDDAVRITLPRGIVRVVIVHLSVVLHLGV